MLASENQVAMERLSTFGSLAGDHNESLTPSIIKLRIYYHDMVSCIHNISYGDLSLIVGVLQQRTALLCRMSSFPHPDNAIIIFFNGSSWFW